MKQAYKGYYYEVIKIDDGCYSWKVFKDKKLIQECEVYHDLPHEAEETAKGLINYLTR
jgi:hypothetical protein